MYKFQESLLKRKNIILTAYIISASRNLSYRWFSRYVIAAMLVDVQGLEYRSGEDHVSSVAAWVILRAPVGSLRRRFRTDGVVEPLVLEGEQTLADILA